LLADGAPCFVLCARPALVIKPEGYCLDLPIRIASPR
jgi:hypothetical protein